METWKTATFSGEHNRVEDTGVRNLKMIIISTLAYMVLQYATTLPQYTYVTKYFSDVGILLKYFRK